MSGAEGLSLLVDARGLRQSGIGRYLRSVLAHLFRDPRFTRFVLLGRPEEVEPFAAAHGAANRAEALAFPYGFYSARAEADWALRQRGRALRADVAFFPHYSVPVWGAHRCSVVAVQDLNHFQLPHLFPAWKRALGARVLRRGVLGARRVLVSSESTRRDLLARIPEAADRVEVVPLGVARDFADGPAARSAGGRAVDSLRPFLLCVGNRKPHKNQVAAVEVLARLRADWPELRLVLAGRRFAEDDGVASRARERGVADAVVELGEVDDDALRGLYAGAECLLFPSLYEGFGLPVLEAMAMGLPVVAADRASTPEVVGDAGLLADPEDPAALAAAVRRLRAEPALRDELVRRGRERAGRLSWEATAARTAEVLWSAGRAAAGEAQRVSALAPAP